MSYRGRKNVEYELVSVCGIDVLLDMRIKRKKIVGKTPMS